MNRQLASKLTNVLPWLTGLLAFLVVAGPRVIDPTNLAWLQGNDPATHYLGWLFFRQSEWSFPLGLNPDYGLELGSAIVYSDSIPLLAFIFKPFDAILPETFQYLGLWLLVCFLLQSCFAWKLAGLITPSHVLRLLASLLFVFSPPMLWRLAGHWSLTGHFLLLAALYIALRPDMEKRKLAWAALLVVVALVHAYLLAMVSLLWLADLAGRTRCRQVPLKDAVFEWAGFVILIVLTCWQAGYFSIGEGLIDGNFYGYFRANLLTLFDPSGWSYWVQDIPEGAGDYEGFNYLGLGVILLGVACLPLLPQQLFRLKPVTERHLFLLLAMLALSAFAFTNKVAIGTFELSYPLPGVLVKVAELFRGSGRMLWPVFYGLVFLIILCIVKGCSHKTAVCLLTFAVAIQIMDTHAGWDTRRDLLMVKKESTLIEAPSDPFWEQAALRYGKVRLLPPANQAKYWKNIAAFAGTHGMSTNAVYLARIDRENYADAANSATNTIASGTYDKDTLYILDASVLETVEATVNNEKDLLATINGVVVLAPGWNE